MTAPGKATFPNEDEARRTLSTRVLGAPDHAGDKRLGHPLGKVDRPSPAIADWNMTQSDAAPHRGDGQSLFATPCSGLESLPGSP